MTFWFVINKRCYLDREEFLELLDEFLDPAGDADPAGLERREDLEPEDALEPAGDFDRDRDSLADPGDPDLDLDLFEDAADDEDDDRELILDQG